MRSKGAHQDGAEHCAAGGAWHVKQGNCGKAELFRRNGAEQPKHCPGQAGTAGQDPDGDLGSADRHGTAASRIIAHGCVQPVRWKNDICHAKYGKN